jgi:hypothetical protein
MTFTTINSAAITVGQPIKADLISLIKTNEDDLNTRLTTVESSSRKVQVFKFYMMNASSFSTATGLAIFRAEESFTLTKGAFQIFSLGTLTGFLEIDVLKNTGNLDTGTWATVFTTKPKITYATAAAGDITTNQVFAAGSIAMTAGQYLRLDITIAPTGGVIPRILLDIYGE